MKNPLNKSKTEALTSASTQWLRIVDNVRTIIDKQTEYIYIPDLSSQTLVML